MNIIKHRGEQQRARLDDGTIVTRNEMLYIPEWGAMVRCTPYDDHFVYHTTGRGSAYMCTCGSVAVVAPPGPTGMFVCQFHATYGKHQTSVVNKKDFGRHIGSTKRI